MTGVQHQRNGYFAAKRSFFMAKAEALCASVELCCPGLQGRLTCGKDRRQVIRVLLSDFSINWLLFS